MNKADARKALRLLISEGWREPELIRYERSWRLYMTDVATGYRKIFDSLLTVQNSLDAAKQGKS